MAIIVKNVTYTYSPGTPIEHEALIDCSVTINEGDFIAVIGHTGSGKTTLMQHLNGLLLPAKNCGTVAIDGEIFTKKNASTLRKQVGYVFQYPEHQLFEETVYKDIAFGLKRLNLTEEQEREKILASCKLVGLDEELLDRSIFELSGGEKRRVAIAGVIVSEPKYLILDEPASGLDPYGKNFILDFMKKYNELGNTVIFISHSMDDVAETAKRVLVVDKGHIVLDGNVDFVFSHYDQLTEMGLDVPEINKLFHRLHKKYAFVNENVFTLKEASDEVHKLMDEGRLIF